jgi:hypothetical protein
MGLDSYDAVLRFLLASIEQSGPKQEIARGKIAELGGPKDQLKGRNLQQAISGIENLEKVKARLAELPEPDAATLQWFLTTVENYRLGLRTAILPFAKKLPHRAGLSPTFTPEEADAFCKKIDHLCESGIRRKEAQRQVAENAGVSLRTIQRIWSDRRGTHTNPTVTS